MIVLDDGDRWRLVTQPDHARFSGELLRLWRGTELAAHPRREEIVFAGREHDNGWRETDAAPSWDAAVGRPHDFLSLPDDRRTEIWLRGSARFASEHPYAALLICLHGLQFYARRGEEVWDGFIDRLERRRDGLLAETETAMTDAAADYRFLRFADAASLAVCNRWRDAVELPSPCGEGALRLRFDPTVESLRVEPFPLAGTTTFRIPVRSIPHRPYAGDADLGGDLSAARWQRMEVRVAREP